MNFIYHILMHLGQIVSYFLVLSIPVVAAGTLGAILFEKIKNKVSESWYAWAMLAGFLVGSVSTAAFSIYNLIHSGLAAALTGALGILGIILICLVLTNLAFGFWDWLTDVDITEGS